MQIAPTIVQTPIELDLSGILRNEEYPIAVVTNFSQGSALILYENRLQNVAHQKLILITNIYTDALREVIRVESELIIDSSIV